MANPTSVDLAESLFQGGGPRGARFSWKVCSLVSVLTFLGLTLLLSGNTIDQASPTTLAALMPASKLGSRSVLASSPQFGGMQEKLMHYGLGSGALQSLAVSALEASNSCGNERDVSARANFRNALASMDPKTKSLVVRASEEVVEEKKFNIQDLAGVTGPMGFFDPLGLSVKLSEGKALFYREVELKHGRVCMLASLGILVGEKFHPLFGGNIDVPAAFAFQQTPLQKFWPLVVAAIAIPEVFSVLTFERPLDSTKGDELWLVKNDRVPGDLNYDPLGLKPTNPKEFLEMQNKELNNGRLAMLATAGMIAQELVTGEKV